MRISDWSSDVCSSDLWRGLRCGRFFGRSLLSRGFLGRCLLSRGFLGRGLLRRGLLRRGFLGGRLLAAAPLAAALGGLLLSLHLQQIERLVQRHALRVDVAWNGGVELAVLHVGTEAARSEEHTSELQSLMRTSYAVFCLK